MSEFPECDKMLAVRQQSMTCSEFLDWLREEGVVLSRYHGERLSPIHESNEVLLAKFFSIDLEKVEQEKLEMLRQCRRGSGSDAKKEATRR